MSQWTAMIPAPVEAKARPSKRLGFSFGRRFFLFLLVGLVWLVPAFVDQRFAYAMLAWDLLLFAAWAADLLSLPKPHELRIRRSWTAPLALSVSSQAKITALNDSQSTLHIRVLDALPASLRTAPPELEMTVAPRNEAEAEYSVQPRRRGTAAATHVYLRYEGAFRIAERWALAELPQELTIYPNLHEAKRQAVYLVRSRQTALEKRFSRIRGAGRAFESLREYQDGDDFGDICWTATARRGKLVTRLYELEKSQTIWIVLDTGRLMRAREWHRSANWITQSMPLWRWARWRSSPATGSVCWPMPAIFGREFRPCAAVRTCGSFWRRWRPSTKMSGKRITCRPPAS